MFKSNSSMYLKSRHKKTAWVWPYMKSNCQGYWLADAKSSYLLWMISIVQNLNLIHGSLICIEFSYVVRSILRAIVLILATSFGWMLNSHDNAHQHQNALSLFLHFNDIERAHLSYATEKHKLGIECRRKSFFLLFFSSIRLVPFTI